MQPIRTERTTSTSASGAAWFAIAGIAAAAVAMVVAIVSAFGAFDQDRGTVPDQLSATADDGAVADDAANPIEVTRRAAEAMGEVTSVEFRIERDGAPIFVDEFEKIALDSLRGQFTIPTRAQAELSVTVNGNLATRLGAVSIDDEVWISNPVTGDFETLPPGYDIDPSRFFDPEGGWKPLLANLGELTLVGVDDRGGERYHIRGVAPAAQVRDITVNLVRDQDVTVDFWIHPATYLVTAAEFDTTIDGQSTQWALELGRYGDTFVIEPPDNVRAAGASG